MNISNHSDKSNSSCCDDMVKVSGILVDVDALCSIAHSCMPGLCTGKGCCCSEYEIGVSSSEVDRIIGYLPDAAGFAPWLDSDDGFENVFEESAPDQFIIDMSDDGPCIFAYEHGKDALRCSLHSVALHQGLSPHMVKPSSCVMWPLAITEDQPVVLSIADDAFRFPCNRKRRGTGRGLDPVIAGIVTDLYGDAFLKQLLHVMHKK